MKKTTIGLCLLAAIVALPFPSSAEGEIHLSNEFSMTDNNVTGSGKGASSLTEGLNYLEVLNVYGSGKTVRGWDYNYNTGAKVTDDRRNDIKSVSLTNIQGRFTNGVHTFNAGDTFETFSQYALATSLKGSSYKFNKEGSKLPEVTAVFGWANPRWDSFWGARDVRVVKRQGMGAKIKQNLTPDLWAGVSAVAAKDTNRLAASDQLYDSRNYTLDFNYLPMPGLTMSGEHSVSNAKESPGSGAAAVSSNGTASKVELVGDADPSRVSVEYENVEKDFFSALGSATPDRRKVKTKWRYKYSKTVTVNSGLLWYRNNLDDSVAAGTTRNWKPEIAVAVKRIFPKRAYSFADFSYKFDRKYGNAQSGADHYLNMNYRDRLGDIDSDSNFGYTMYRTRTNVRKANELNFNTSFNSRRTVKDWVLKPSVNLGAWYSRDELASTTDKIYEYSLGLGAEASGAGVTGDLRFGRNTLTKSAAGADDSTKTFAAFNAYWRPTLLAGLKDSTVFLRAGLNDFSFSTSSNNFREKSVTVGLNTAF